LPRTAKVGHKVMRRHPVEFVVAWVLFAFFYGMTVYLLVALVVPFFYHQQAFYHEYLMSFISLCAIIAAWYVLTLALWAIRCTSAIRRSGQTDWYSKCMEEGSRRVLSHPNLNPGSFAPAVLPMSDVNFTGPLDRALDKAKGERRWLLLGILHSNDNPEALVLQNPDLEANVKSSFVAWIRDASTDHAETFFKRHTLRPGNYICIIDPASGNIVRAWQSGPSRHSSEVIDMVKEMACVSITEAVKVVRHQNPRQVAMEISNAATGASWDSLRHFMVITNYKEPVKLLQTVLNALVAQEPKQLPKQNIVVVLAMEAREVDAEAKVRELKQAYASYFLDIYATYHPPGIDGEVPGKASNYRWAVKMIEEYLFNPSLRSKSARSVHFDPMCSLVHVLDADSLVDKGYLSEVSYHFCTQMDRYYQWYQPVMLQSLNFWDVPIVTRLTSMMIGVHEMACLSDPITFQVPFSTWGVPFKLLQGIGNGQAAVAQDGDVICDDHHLFIKGFFATRRRLRVCSIFQPVPNFAVGSSDQSWCANIGERFTQATRHTFGFTELVFVLERTIRCLFCCLRVGTAAFPDPTVCELLRGYVRNFALIIKMFTIHSISVISGIWIVIGGATLLYYETAQWCDKGKGGDDGTVCKAISKMAGNDATRFLGDAGTIAYQVGATASLVGMCIAAYAWVRMLRVTQDIYGSIGQFPLTHIVRPHMDEREDRTFASASPSQISESPGSTGSGIHEPVLRPAVNLAAEQLIRRQQTVVGFPWFGCVLQLVVESIIFGVPSSVIFGSIPALISIYRVAMYGHTGLTYKAASRPGAAPAQNEQQLAPIPNAGQETLTEPMLTPQEARLSARV